MVKRMSHHDIVHSADGKKSKTMFFESETCVDKWLRNVFFSLCDSHARTVESVTTKLTAF